MVRVLVEAAQLPFVFNLEVMKIPGLRFDLHRPESV